MGHSCDPTDDAPDWEDGAGRLEVLCSQLEGRAAATRQTEALLRSILDNVPDFVIKLSPDGTIDFVNRVAPGLTMEEVIGASVYDYIEPSYHDTVRSCIERVMQTGEPDSYQIVGMGTYGKPAHYLTRLSPLKRGDDVESLVMIAADVTSLVESREKLEVALSSSGLGLWEWQREVDRVEWDATTCAILGVDAAPGSFAEYLELVHPSDRARVEANVGAALESGVFTELEHRVLRPGGELRWVMCKGRVERDPEGKVVRLRGGIMDITARHSLEEQLVQAQKMEALGQLAAGIAHNFNNMLTVMLSSMELATRKVSGEPAALLRGGQEAALKAAQMVRQLLMFSGKTRGASRRPEDIATLVQRTVDMSRTTFGDEISMSLQLPSEPLAVCCDAGQIEQALLNVLINARDALDEHEGAESRIAISVEGVRGGPDGRPEVRISVVDNGPGMPDEVRRRIFEPFFTTKAPGRGTGLGLATAYAIIREHGGRVECHSSPGAGTLFHLFLPAGADAPQAVDGVRVSAPLSGRGEHVLVVDDEPMIRQLMTDVLGGAGYAVETAVDGIDAIERVRARPDRYRVVLLDQSMPRLAGRAALQAIRRISPTLKIVCFSGFSVAFEGADAVLQKPVPAQRLIETIEVLLGRR